MNRLLLSLCAALALTLNAAAQIADSTKQYAHDVFKELIEINTTDSVGNVTTAAEAMAQRFRDAGSSRGRAILGPNERKRNSLLACTARATKSLFS